MKQSYDKINTNKEESNNLKNIGNIDMKTRLKTLLNIKKTNKDIANEIISQKLETSNLSKLVTQLEYELNFHKKISSQLQEELYLVSAKKDRQVNSERECQNYCLEIKKKFKSIVETVERFEDELKELTKTKEKYQIDYENIIEDLINRRCEMSNDLDDINEKIDSQKYDVEDLVRKEKELIQRKLEKKREFDEDLKKKEEEYIKLNEKYKELYEKMKYYKNYEMNIEHEKVVCNNEYNRLNHEKNEKMLELYDKLSKNKNLKNENDKLNDEIKDLNSIIISLERGV